MAFGIDDPWRVLYAAGLCVVGLLLLIFYGCWLHVATRRRDPTGTEHQLALLGGWFGGCGLVPGAVLLLLPARLAWVSVPPSVVLLLCFFPIASFVRRSRIDGSS